MADFTSAAQFVGRPQVQLEDPMQTQMKAASLAQAMQQQQMGAMQLQKAQIDLKDQQILRDAGKGLDWGDPASLNKLLANASSMGASPMALSQLQQHIADARKKAADTDLAVLKLDTEKKDQFAGQLRALQQRPDWGSPESQSIYGNLANRAIANGWLTKEQVPAFPTSPTALEPFINGLKLESAINKDAAAGFKELGGVVYDTRGGKLTPAAPIPSAQEYSDLIDKTIPATGATADLNKAAKAESAFHLGRNDIKSANEVLNKYGAEVRKIQDITNPILRQAAIDKAAAEAAATTTARLKVEQANQTGAVAKLNPTTAAAASKEFFNTTKDFNTAMQAADNMDSFIKAAESGNKVAHSFVPAEGALEASTAQGVKRINTAEIKSFGGAGSVMDRIEGQLKGLATGQSIPPNILKDMKQLSDSIRENATKKHESAVKSVNVAYGSSFKPLNNQSAGAASSDDLLKALGH